MVLLSDGETAAAGPVEEEMSRFDLRHMTGRYKAGAVLGVTVAGHDEEFELTRLAFAGGELKVSRLPLPEGARRKAAPWRAERGRAAAGARVRSRGWDR